MTTNGTPMHTVAVVIPVYRGEMTLPGVVAELDRLTEPQLTPGGNPYFVSEVVLVHDCGPDHSDIAIRELERRYPYVRPVWLARNYGQHAATLAGISSSSADWVVTMDEDGQHDPHAIAGMLDRALESQSPLVYAKPTNKPPHSSFRNVASRTVHGLARVVGTGDLRDFHSFRLMLGEIGRGLAAYCGEGVYLDVALTWVASRSTTYPVAMRDEGGRASGYTLRQLASHWWRMMLTAGTRPLRLVALLGVALGLIAIGLTGWVIYAKVSDEVPVQGWTSVMVILLVTSGAMLFSLGVLAEYLGVAARSVMGKPVSLVVNDPAKGPLGRVAVAPSEAGEQNATLRTEVSARTEA
jgi:glycosyltransferase involved in cell wall biosynthesis